MSGEDTFSLLGSGLGVADGAGVGTGVGAGEALGRADGAGVGLAAVMDESSDFDGDGAAVCDGRGWSFGTIFGTSTV